MQNFMGTHHTNYRPQLMLWTQTQCLSPLVAQIKFEILLKCVYLEDRSGDTEASTPFTGGQIKPLFVFNFRLQIFFLVFNCFGAKWDIYNTTQRSESSLCFHARRKLSTFASIVLLGAILAPSCCRCIPQEQINIMKRNLFGIISSMVRRENYRSRF